MEQLPELFPVMVKRTNRVTTESVDVQLNKIIMDLKEEYSAIDASFEKLLIAITNVLKLTGTQKGTLTSLQGTPQELQGYLIEMVSRIRKKNTQAINRSLERLTALADNLE